MELGCNKNLRLYLLTQYSPNTGRKLGKGKKKTPRRHTKVGTFTTITHRTKNINKPGHAK